MQQLNKELDNSIIEKINYLVLNDLSSVCDVWVAGGAILSVLNQVSPNDIDLFFKNENDLKKAMLFFTVNSGKVYYESDKVIKIQYKSLKLDLVKIYFESPLQCINDFDFDICKAYVYQNELFLHNGFKTTFKQKLLVISGNIQYPFSTLYRLQKYTNKGYILDYNSCKKIYEAIKNSTGTDEEEFYDNNIVG
jgi:hypothetical protein